MELRFSVGAGKPQMQLLMMPVERLHPSKIYRNAWVSSRKPRFATVEIDGKFYFGFFCLRRPSILDVRATNSGFLGLFGLPSAWV